ncbi:MAG: hypothetical protein H8E39_09305 [Alphaproteobacteria bacterium]|nr:hypothetical protein [Alphaproteobacteria bacterium]
MSDVSCVFVLLIPIIAAARGIFEALRLDKEIAGFTDALIGAHVRLAPYSGHCGRAL